MRSNGSFPMPRKIPWNLFILPWRPEVPPVRIHLMKERNSAISFREPASIHLGNKTYKAKKGESFYYTAGQDPFPATNRHGASLIWVSSPQVLIYAAQLLEILKPEAPAVRSTDFIETNITWTLNLLKGELRMAQPLIDLSTYFKKL